MIIRKKLGLKVVLILVSAFCIIHAQAFDVRDVVESILDKRDEDKAKELSYVFSPELLKEIESLKKLPENQEWYEIDGVQIGFLAGENISDFNTLASINKAVANNTKYNFGDKVKKGSEWTVFAFDATFDSFRSTAAYCLASPIDYDSDVFDDYKFTYYFGGLESGVDICQFIAINLAVNQLEMVGFDGSIVVRKYLQKNSVNKKTGMAGALF